MQKMVQEARRREFKLQGLFFQSWALNCSQSSNLSFAFVFATSLCYLSIYLSTKVRMEVKLEIVQATTTLLKKTWWVLTKRPQHFTSPHSTLFQSITIADNSFVDCSANHKTDAWLEKDCHWQFFVYPQTTPKAMVIMFTWLGKDVWNRTTFE